MGVEREHARSRSPPGLAVLAGDMGLGEGRHAGMAGERGAKHEHGDRGARAFAEPHAEIEQRLKAELLQQEAVARLGRQVSGERMVERIGAELCERRHGSGRDEAVDQNRDARAPRGEAGAEDRGKLAAAERGGDAERIVEAHHRDA